MSQESGVWSAGYQECVQNEWLRTIRALENAEAVIPRGKWRAAKTALSRAKRAYKKLFGEEAV